MSDVTEMLAAIERGDRRAADDLLPLVYGELRSLARKLMRGERPEHTLQATALVHEAYVRLVGARDVSWSDRRHFFRTAAEAMRRILIDHARRRGRQKRAGSGGQIPLDAVELIAGEKFEEFLILDDAIQRLCQQDPRAADVVRLRFFAGLDLDETAAALDISTSTVKREWTFAKAWLGAILREQ